MLEALHSTQNIILMADAVPAATKYVLRSIQDYCMKQNLTLPKVWVVSRQPQTQNDMVSWIPTPPPAVGNKDFQYLAVLKFAVAHVLSKGAASAIEVMPLPCFSINAEASALPVARYKEPQEECTTCKSDGIKGMTLRALKRMGKPYYEYDLGSPFVVHGKQLVDMAMGMQIPYAVETYYNNTHNVVPGSFIDSLRVIAEQRFLSTTPGQITEALANVSMVAFTQNGWNRWVAAWCESRWPNACAYEALLQGLTGADQ